MNEFLDDEDESFYKDISFDTFNTIQMNSRSSQLANTSNYENRLPNFQYHQVGLRIQTPTGLNSNGILINRSQPSPVIQKRPPHLRLNNL